MKGTIFVILALVVFVQGDRDLSSFRPNHLNVIPERLTLGSRIVGGEEARPHQYPHQVAIFNKVDFCGGSVIDANTILTAAHCFDSEKYAVVLAGIHDLTNLGDREQRRISRDIVVHPGWHKARALNDIALVRLPKPLELNEYVKVIDLYRGDSDLVGEEATISGWGRYTASVQGTSEVLRHVTGLVITNTECAKDYGRIPKSVICLSGSSGKGSCSGDSGGPLIHNNNGVIEQIGIAAFASERCNSGIPSGYTRISSLRDWINENRLS